MAPTEEDLHLYALYCFDVLYARLTSQKMPSPTSLPNHKQEFPLFVTWNTVSSSTGTVRLRGCIGNFEKMRLGSGLAEYALISALKDRRFNPISSRELSRLECHISLLSRFEPTTSYLDWTIGTHGIYISFPNPELTSHSLLETEEDEDLEKVYDPDVHGHGPMSLDDSPSITPSSNGSSNIPSQTQSSTSIDTVESIQPSGSSSSKTELPSILKSHLTSLIDTRHEQREYSLSELLPRGYDQLTATYLPDVAKEQEWDKVETLDSLMHKAGWDGSVTESMRRKVKVVRYQCLKGKASYKEWKKWRVGQGQPV